jgi:hypothetical protein
MEVIKNPNVKQAIKIVTIAGASVLVVGSVLNLLKAKSLKDGVMPVVAILVGASAFGYAMNKKISPATVGEPKSSAAGTPAKSAAKVQYDSCNGRCGSGQRCVKGTCI